VIKPKDASMSECATHRRVLRLFAMLLLLALPLLLGWDLMREFIAEDRCLDSGGVYDDRQDRCLRDRVHLPRVSYWQRRLEHIVLGGFSMLLGGWMLGRGELLCKNLETTTRQLTKKGKKNMLKALFGDIAEGRLQRLQFLGYWLFLVLLSFGFAIAVGLSIGAAEQLIGGDLQQAQDKLREWLSLPFLAVFAVVGVLFLFAELNIVAKRVRDIGLPGWWMVLAIVVVTGGTSFAISGQAGNGLSTLIMAALLLIPSDACARKENLR
jgi:uncharacterized membrane protein YhaH (DUF805 family)